MYNTKEDLIFALLNEIGLSIDNNNTLIDQDNNGERIYFGGKLIKCSLDPNRPVYNSEIAIVFDPVDDIRLMTTILAYYLEKERVLGESYPIAYGFNNKDKQGPSTISVKIQTHDRGIIEVTSNLYYNKCLVISDVILRMGGQYSDLSNFDQK